MNKTQALHQFWNRFGLTAYEENSVPDDTRFPYITYSNEMDSFENVCLLTGNLWYRTDSWKSIIDKSEEISKYIKEHGFVTIPFDHGYLYITGGTPFAQSINEPSDDKIKRILININVEYLSSY
jgi:hypothetical protein